MIWLRLFAAVTHPTMRPNKAASLLFIAVTFFCALVERASAIPITINFTGVVTSSTAGLYAYPPGYVPIVGPAVGDLFSGSVTYDPAIPLTVDANVTGLNDYRVSWLETPTGIFVVGDWATFRGGITLSLNAAREVTGGTFSFTGTPFDTYADFSGVINGAANNVPDSTFTLSLMVIGLLALTPLYHKARFGNKSGAPGI